jgi:AcrR family transcriptional regulator
MLVSSTSMNAASDATTAMSHGLNLGTQSDAGLGRSVILAKMVAGKVVKYENYLFDMIADYAERRKKIGHRHAVGDNPLKRGARGESGLLKRTAGRPRSEKTRRAILRSAFRLLKEHGFAGVSMQQIVTDAGVSTATVYRWWKNKQEILLEAYLETVGELLPSRNRMTALKRLREYTVRIAAFLESENGRVFLKLLMAIQEDRELYDAFYEKVFQPRRAEGCEVVREAMAAGDLPSTVDPDFIIDLLIGPQVLRALLGKDATPDFAARIFEFVVRR